MISIQLKMYQFQSWFKERVNDKFNAREYISLGIKMVLYKGGEVAKDSQCVVVSKFTMWYQNAEVDKDS